MRKQIGGDINTQVKINTQEINILTNQVNQLKSFVDSLEKSSSQPSSENWKAQSVESIQQKKDQRTTEQTPTPVQEQQIVTTQSQLSEEDEKAAKRAQIQANVNRAQCQQRNAKLQNYNAIIDKCGSLSNWGNTQDKVVPGVTMNGQNVICSTQLTGSVNDTLSSKIMGNQNQENLREALCQGKQQCVYNIPVNKKDFKKAKIATLEDCQSAGKKTNTTKNKRSNKKSSRKQRAGNLCQQNRCQQLSLMNDKLNIYAPYPNNSGPFPAAAFTGNYRIDGPIPRGTTVPQAIHQVNLRKNVYPGGKTRKNKLNKRKTKRRN